MTTIMCGGKYENEDHVKWFSFSLGETTLIIYKQMHCFIASIMFVYIRIRVRNEFIWKITGAYGITKLKKKMH